jgi:hypothetical protein
MIRNLNLKRSPFIIFLPFLVLYLVVVLIYAKNENTGDEIRYLNYAHNLTQGYFSLSYPYIDLGNGPGYPLILMPFVAFKIPLIYLKLLNGVFYYFSVIFFYKSLQRIVPLKFVLVFSIIWALYPNTFEELPYTLPEVFASSLIPIFIFFVLRSFENGSSKKSKYYLLVSGLIFGYLVLTKPIFGYVLWFMIGGILLLWILKRKATNYRTAFILLMISFFTTIPYIGYTYSLTGKLFYLSSFGGNNLYWMTTPYEGEYGEYFTYPFVNLPDRIPGSKELIAQHHNKDFEKLLENPEVRKANILEDSTVMMNVLYGTTQDNLLRKIAYKNIKSHPLKFLQNCISNAGRMIFNYPGSYVLQKPSTLKRLPVNGTLLVFCFFCFFLTIYNWKNILFPIRFLLFFSFLYFGGSLLGSAEPRMFTIIVPVLLVWIAYILKRTIVLNLRILKDAG